jgi:hypothetical protein
MKKAGGH